MESGVFQLELRDTYYHAASPGEHLALMNKALRFRMALEVDTGTQCGVGMDDELLICTNNPPSLLSLHWNGEVNIPGTLKLSNLGFILDYKDAFAQITVHSKKALFGIITLDGKAYLATRKLILDENDDDKTKATMTWDGICFYNDTGDQTPATTICFNPKFTLVAVGTLDGVVQVFDVPNDIHKTSHSHALAITNPGNHTIPAKISAVTALSWTRDGFALAVSWVYGGLSVWSVYGSLLMSTLSEDTYAHATDGIVTNTNELFFTGTQDLFWDISGHDLYLLPASHYEKGLVILGLKYVPTVDNTLFFYRDYIRCLCASICKGIYFDL